MTGNSTVVSTQLVNNAGQPWAIAGKTVDWICQVLQDDGTDVTATWVADVADGLNPTSSTTDASGHASTVLTTDPALTGVRYLVSPSTPD